MVDRLRFYRPALLGAGTADRLLLGYLLYNNNHWLLCHSNDRLLLGYLLYNSNDWLLCHNNDRLLYNGKSRLLYHSNIFVINHIEI